MKRILLNLIILTTTFSLNALAAAGESDASVQKVQVNLVMYGTSTVHTPGESTLITMTGNPGAVSCEGPFRDLNHLKEFVTRQLYAFQNHEQCPHTILAITALSDEESDAANKGNNPDGALTREIMSDDEMTAQMALLNAVLEKNGHGAIRAKIQFY